MHPQLLIFDLDGTLLNTVADLATAVNLMRAQYGLAAIPEDLVAEYVGDGMRMLVSRALQGFPADVDEALRFHAAFYRLHLHDRTQPYPGVVEGLPELQRCGHTLALATNKSIEATEALLRHFGLREHFCSVMGGGSGPKLKPDPDMLLTIMRDVGASPVATWMVGDHHTDMEAARRAGCRSAFLAYGIGNLGDEQATGTFADFADFVRAFGPGAA